MAQEKTRGKKPPRVPPPIAADAPVSFLYTITMVVVVGGGLWLYRSFLARILREGRAFGFDQDQGLVFGGVLVLLSLSFAVAYIIIRVYEVFPPIDLAKSPQANQLPRLFWLWQPLIKDIQTKPSRLEGLLLAFVSYVFTLSTFAVTYWFIAASEPGCFSKSLDAFQAVYFSVVTMATVGYGDIFPLCPKAQLFVMGQIFTGLLYAVVVFSIALDSTKR